jgi:hypothetical protein
MTQLSHLVAAALALGRERVISVMCRRLLTHMAVRRLGRWELPRSVTEADALLGQLPAP